MIRSFKHRGLKRLYEQEDRRGIRPDLVEDIEDILGRLDRAETPQAMNLPGYRLHLLRWPERVLVGDGAGELADRFSIRRYRCL